RGERRQACHHQDAERRKSPGARRNADPGLRRLGALILYRLSQPAARLSQGIPRPPGELGTRRRNVRGREQVDIRKTSTARSRQSDAWSADQTADRLAIGVLLVIAVVAALTFRDYGLGWDDYTHSQYGDLLLKLYGSGFTDQRALSFVNLYKYGGGF